ncbi:hypothetical protein OIO90_006406 [Microbotryomycetes sp. JL221]|nr:hypothetical protein OIO90_006406 [Microbotryomycetes sp. JL221]
MSQVKRDEQNASVDPVSASSSPSSSRNPMFPPSQIVIVVLVAIVSFTLGSNNMTFFGSLTKSMSSLSTHNSTTVSPNVPFVNNNNNNSKFISKVKDLGLSGCPPQPEPINMGSDWNPSQDVTYVKLAIERLQGSIRIPTETYDDMKLPHQDERFKIFDSLHEYLKKTFSLTHETLKVEQVARYGLLMTWQGSNSNLKPIVLMAHQDVVPVNPSTWDRWTHLPYSGDLDDKGWIWGLIGVLSAVEKLIEEGFEPRRTVILSFGADEEVGGRRTAKPLSELLLSRYGSNGIEFIIDESFAGLDVQHGQLFAQLGMSEKGAVSVKVSVSTNGGHSSVPPHHTGIGILSRLMVELEKNPFQATLKDGSPIARAFECVAEHGSTLPDKIKQVIKDKSKWNGFGLMLSKKNPVMRAFLGTTQAVNLVQGGVKVNALPESTSATINYRIDFQSSVNETLTHIENVLRPVVEQEFGFTLESFAETKQQQRQQEQAQQLDDLVHDHDVHAHNKVVQAIDLLKLGDEAFGHGHVRLETVFKSEWEPAPLTRSDTQAFKLISGTIRHVFKDAVVAPSGMIANTDTKWVWKLTENIFRFVPARLELITGFHTVDERIHTDAHLTGIQFFYKLIQNVQGLENV